MKRPTTLEKLRGPQDINDNQPDPAPEPEKTDKKDEGIETPVIHQDDLEDVRQTPSKPGLEKNEDKPDEKDGEEKQEDFTPEALQSIFWPGRKKKAKEGEPKPEDKKAEDAPADDTKPAEKKAEKPKKEAKKPVVEEDEDEPVDTNRLVKDAVSSAVEATAKAMKQPAKEPDADTTPDLDDDEQYLAKVYDRIEEDEGIKGVGKQFRSGVLKMKEYRRKWESEHPGDEWDAEADEHSAYYEKVMPDVPSRLIRSAEARIAADEAVDKKTKPLKEENVELRRKVFDTEIAPSVAQTTDAMLVEIAKSIGDEVGDAIKTTDGVKQLEEADPVAIEVIRGFAGHAAALNTELTRVSRSGGLYTFDDRNQVHLEIRGIVKTAQEQIKALPRSKRLSKGKEFATHAEWNRMTPAERESHWILEEQHIRGIITENYSSAAKSAYDREMAKIERYGGARKSSIKKKEVEPKDDSAEQDEEPIPQTPTRDAISSVKAGASKSTDEIGSKVRGWLWGR